MTALIIAVVVCAASFIPATDLDAPKVYYKACIYCKGCTPVCELMEVDSLRGLCCDYFGEVRLLTDTAYYENRFGGHCDSYRCQRTGKRMVFDSLGVVAWGAFVRVDTFYFQSGEGTKWESIPILGYQFDYLQQDSTKVKTTVIADTSGVRRLQ